MKKRLAAAAIALLMLFSNVCMPTVSAWLIQGTTGEVSCFPFSATIRNMNGNYIQLSTTGDSGSWTNTLNKAQLSAAASNSIPDGLNSFTPVSFSPAAHSFVGGAYHDGSFSAASAEKGTYMKLTFYIRSYMCITGEISPTFSSDSDYAFAAINTGTNTCIYNRTTGRSYTPIVDACSTGMDSNANKVMEQGEINSSSLGERVTASNNSSVPISMLPNTAMTITVYLWLEMQDYSCANSVAIPNLTFDLQIHLDGDPPCGLTGSYSTSADVTGDSLLLSADRANWNSKLDETDFTGVGGNSFPEAGCGLVPVSFNPANRTFMDGCLIGNYNFNSMAMTAANGEYIKYTVYAKLPYNTEKETEVILEPSFSANIPFIYAAINDGVHTNIYNSNPSRSYYPIAKASSGYDANRNQILDTPEVSSSCLGPMVTADNTSRIVLTFTPGEIKELTVYMWAEGQDPSCAGTISGYTTGLDLLFSAPEAPMSGIDIATLPAKTTYIAGDSLDTTGLTLLATFSDGATKTISDGFTCNPAVLTAAGTKTITVDYNGLSTSFNVEVLTNAPAGLTSPDKTAASVDLVWDAVPGATGYNVYNGSAKANETPITGTTYTVTGLSQNTSYSFTVKAFSEGGESAASTALSVTTSSTEAVAVSSVKLNISQVNIELGQSVTFLVTVLPTDATNKTVSWSSSNTKVVTIDDTGMANAVAVGSVIITCTANDGSGKKATCIINVIPSAPTSPKATSASYNSIEISWDAVSGASGYEVYRYNSSEDAYEQIITTATSYTDVSLITGKTYYYKLRAYKIVGGRMIYSEFTEAVSSKPLPAAPDTLAAVNVSSTSIKLSWSVVPGANGYEVYQATSSTGTFGQIATTESTSYTDTLLIPGKTYYYRLRAYKVANGAKIYSEFTEAVSIELFFPVPTGLASPGKTAATVDLSWDGVTEATSYNVYNGSIKVNETPITGTMYTVIGLTQNTSYSFTVKAVIEGEESAASAALVVTTTIYKTGDIISFGSYPQTKVTDMALISALNSCTLSADNSLIYGNLKYKKVYFTQYTPVETDYSPSAENSVQDDNGYYINTVYWFKYEPIQWRVLSNIDGELFVMAEKTLDSQAYNQIDKSITWETCTLRSWLNNIFYNAAFSPAEKSLIITSNVINYDNNNYGTEGGNNTNDNLFLLSENEAINSAYGFSSIFDDSDTTRIMRGTDFSKCNGLYSSSNGTNAWWLRSPGAFSYMVSAITYLGEGHDQYGVDWTNVGIQPVFKLRINNSISLTSESKTDTTVSLSWNGVFGATGYNVYNGSTKVNATPITDTTYTVTGLTQSTGYLFTVKAVNAGLDLAESTPLAVTTSTYFIINNGIVTGYLGLGGDVIIPDGITGIGNGVFANLLSITSVSIPTGVTSIGNSAFWNCSNLKSINIPASVKSIGIAAFSGCTSLTNVYIPRSVAAIGQNAFKNCTGLRVYSVSGTYAETYALTNDLNYMNIDINAIGAAAVVDRQNGLIYGLDKGTKSITNKIETFGGAELEFIMSDDTVFGTGSIVNIKYNGEVIKTYTVVIFGDVNGDGNIDAEDADKCVDVQNWKANWNHDTQGYYYKAADLNGDGNVDVLDSDLISEIGNWTMHIDQTTGLAVMN